MWEIALLFSSCQLLAGRGGRRKNRKRESVREFTSNLEKIMGFCVDLAEDRMP